MSQSELLIKEAAKGSGVALIGGVFGKIGAFGLHILLGRVLGPVSYGLYSLGYSVGSIAQAVGTLGLKQGVVRYCSVYHEQCNREKVKTTIQSALFVALLSSILLAVIIYMLSGTLAERFFKKSELTQLFKMFSVAFPFFVLMGITAAFAQSFRRIKVQQSIQNIFYPLSNLLLAAAAFYLGYRLNGAVFAFILAGVSSACFGFYHVMKFVPDVFRRSTASYETGKILAYSIPLFMIGIAYLLLTYTDRIMLGYFMPSQYVGIYNAAASAAIQLIIFHEAFIAVFSPFVSALHSSNQKRDLKKLFTTGTRWVFSLTLPIFLLMAFFSKEIILVFGSRFAEGWKVLIILAFAQLINAGTGPVGIILHMTGKQNIDLINGLILMCLNIALNIYLIPKHGAEGAAAATALSLICVHILRLIEVAVIFKMVPYDKHYFKLLAPGLAAALAFASARLFPSLSPWIFLLFCAGGLFLYGGILYLFGLPEEDRIVLTAVKNKIARISS